MENLMHIYNETDEIATCPFNKPLPYPLNLVTTVRPTEKLPYKKQVKVVRKEEIRIPELDRDSAVIYQKKSLQDSKRILHQHSKNRQRFVKPESHTIQAHTGGNLGKTLALLRAGKKIRIQR